MATRLNISIPDDLVEAVKQVKEDIGISRFFRNKLKEYLQAKNNEQYNQRRSDNGYQQ